MKELIRTNDIVFLSWVQAALANEDIEVLVFDQYVSAVEGSIGALPRRVMVADEDFSRAQAIIKAAEAGDAS